MSWTRREAPSHGCERLDRHDLATLDPCHELATRRPAPYPWERWIEELGQRPRDSYWSDRFRRGRREARQDAIAEKHLKRYLDEFAFFFNRLELDPWAVFNDLLAGVLKAHPLTYRTLVERDPLRPWLELEVDRPS